ncbi:MAG: hypothetical protein A2275_03090 [Bacteroidetes bacterium RIFOXYA12_FULL_35_11]|nr:MAG: hypothetical protein A2X01_05055 [Bacteroidetes bacterium GWF2_35_48]OFY80767.1 MAG: hypothetical protein A2275_03090 [Bacteroidetes bacterium RIFOXYA12_FULL_35_11]OFY99979.1 MAG: hypothetical protein A2491_00785 [Bacteroidetes bacterium RIFOXYC12_FULL_35_7]HBX52952.1 hypothetical protein [Bacteroidales bacterium]
MFSGTAAYSYYWIKEQRLFSFFNQKLIRFNPNRDSSEIKSIPEDIFYKASAEYYKQKYEKKKDSLYATLCNIVVMQNSFLLIDKFLSKGKTHPFYKDLLRDSELLHYKITSSLNTIKSFTYFIEKFPDSGYLPELKTKRRKQYLSIPDLRRQHINIDSFLNKNPCYIPFLKVLDDSIGSVLSINEVLNDSLSNAMFKNRYLVADLNTIGYDGNCKGVVEVFPEISKLRDFSMMNAISVFHNIDFYDLAEMDSLSFIKLLPHLGILDYAFYEKELLMNYIYKVDTFCKSIPLIKKPVYEYLSRKFCSGQTLCLCEAQNDTIIQVARFIAAGKGDVYFGFNAAGLKNWFYGSVNIVRSRFWSTDRKYTAFERHRDKFMGGGYSVHCIYYPTECELPNFLGFLPVRAYPNACRGNGIHELAVGPFRDALMGTPSSLGCIRIKDYAAKFTRWWTPIHAKLFIYFEESNVKQLAPQKK